MTVREGLRTRLRHATAATAIVGATVSFGPGSSAHAQACREVVSSARAESTVARVDASSGAALAVPATYSQLIYDSIPSVAYNQSGPSTTGPLEDPTGTNPNTLLPTAVGFLPLDPPVGVPGDAFGPNPPFIPAPPVVGRAEAAYPTLRGIPQDSESSAGPTQAEAHAYPDHSSGRATSTGLGGTDGGVRTGSAFTHASLECETLTLVVGWEATGVVTAGGTIPSLSQVATLTVSPSGASATVATNIAEETEEGAPVVEGQPLANPVLDGFNEQGTYVDVGEPRITVEGNRATVSGGGIRYGTADPSRNDTFTFYTIGSLEGVVDLGSVLPTFQDPDAGPSPQPTSPVPGSMTGGSGGLITTTVVQRAPAGGAGAGSVTGELATASVQLSGLTEDLTTGSSSIWPAVLALLALGMIGRVTWWAADLGRDRFPTAGFAVDWFRDRGRRFATSYLAW